MDFVLGHPRSATMFVSNLLDAGEPGVSDHELLYKMHRDLVWLASEYDAGRAEVVAVKRLLARYQGVVPRIDCNWKLTWILPVLLEVFPDARVVHLTRDPLANVRSCLELDYYGDTRFDESTHRGRGRNYWLHWMPRQRSAEWERLTAFEKNCWFWTTTHERLLAVRTRLGSRYLQARVEDLGERPAVDRLCDFLGIARISDQRLAEAFQKRVNVKQSEKELSAKLGAPGAAVIDERRLRDLCGRVAVSLGYSQWAPPARSQSAMVAALGGAEPLAASQLDALFAAKAENLKRAWAHFDARDVSLTSRPFRLSIELTQNCNFKCTMCSQSWDARFQKYNPEYNMRPELFAKLAEELFPAALNVDLRGFGETTLLPYWPELVESLERFPFVEWNLISNMSLRRDDVWDRMIRNRFVIGASIDASTAGTFERIRRGADFRTIRHNLHIVSDSIRRHGSGSLYFISVIQRSNAHEMRGIVELAHEVGCNEVQFHVSRGQSAVALQGEFVLDRAGMARYTGDAIDAALELGVTTTFNAPVFTRGLDPDLVARASTLPPRRPDPSTFHGMAAAAPLDSYVDRLLDAYRIVFHRRCFKPFSYANINHRGEMGTCNHMQHPEMPVMGNLAEQPLLDVWNGALYRHFRQQLLDASPEDQRCQWCFSARLTD
jgi:radical SAM protein with 4Fe4S-binding SPASM domain